MTSSLMFETPGATSPHYRGGTGDPLVLVHAGGASWRQWTSARPTAVSGGVEPTVTADGSGRALVEIDLEDRPELRLAQAP